MPERSAGPKWAVLLARIWAIAAYVLVAVAFFAGTVWLVMAKEVKKLTGTEAVLAWVVGLAALPAAVLTVAIVRAAVVAIARGEQGTADISDHLKRLESLIETLHDSTRRLVDLSRMSDAAKSLLFRQREVEAMEELLHDYLMRQDYTAAEQFADEVERRLGQLEQAQRMRQEIAAARETTMEQKIESAIKRVHDLVADYQWARALRVTQRLLRVQGDHPKVAALPGLIHEARTRHKLELLHDYDQAVKRNDIERSIQLLHELDKYLTPQEAAALEESARGVFKARLHTLGVQFSMRVTEENWAEAIAIGHEIMQEFPNSRMAKEVSEKMDRLVALAAQEKR